MSGPLVWNVRCAVPGATLIPHGNGFTFVDMNHGANMSTPQVGNSYLAFGEVPNPWASVPGGNAIWCSACHR